jgi:hypothetical protein
VTVSIVAELKSISVAIGWSPSAGGPFKVAMSLQTQTTLERAFELAQTGKCRTVTELRLKLRGEGFDVDQITGPKLLKQLNALLGSAQPAELTEASEKQA